MDTCPKSQSSLDHAWGVGNASGVDNAVVLDPAPVSAQALGLDRVPGADTVALVWGEDLLGMDFGPGHPMSPSRLGITWDLVERWGLLEAPGVCVRAPAVAPMEALLAVHDAGYVDAVRRASATGVADVGRGLGTEDNPIFPGMHEAASRIVGATLAVSQAVWEGQALHGVNIAGGMHHAQWDRASGFCIYNDVTAGIQWLLDHGAKRVAYVDFDAHHGDGVERTFWNNPHVLTFSVHQSGDSLFPGTGDPWDVGGPDARGSAVNLPVPAGTDSASWLRAIDAVLPQVLARFAPDVIVSQHGCDTHRRDVMSDLRVSLDAQRIAAAWIHALAHRLCQGKWVALGGGGYDVDGVVPVAWASLLAEALHEPVDIPGSLPEVWQRKLEQASGGRIIEEQPVWLPWPQGVDPVDDAIAQCVDAVAQCMDAIAGCVDVAHL